jgi:hypothetical protein
MNPAVKRHHSPESRDVKGDPDASGGVTVTMEDAKRLRISGIKEESDDDDDQSWLQEPGPVKVEAGLKREKSDPGAEGVSLKDIPVKGEELEVFDLSLSNTPWGRLSADQVPSGDGSTMLDTSSYRSFCNSWKARARSVVGTRSDLHPLPFRSCSVYTQSICSRKDDESGLQSKYGGPPVFEMSLIRH